MTFDISAHLGAVRRQVRNHDIEGQQGKVIAASRRYETTPGELWDALTDPARLECWFAPVGGELALGGRYHIEGNASGTITACVPKERVEMTWEFGGTTSWVTLSLTPEGDGTLLVLEHLSPLNPHWTRYGAGAAGVGWELSFLGLAAHLERPAEDVRAEGLGGWETSPEALDLVRQASAGWSDAEIAGGEEPGQARSAAEATRRFYSGEPPQDD